MTAPGRLGRWLSQRISLRGVWAWLIADQNPVCRYRLTYAAVLGLVVWSTRVCTAYRVLGYPLVAVLPVVGTLAGYLWAILLANELLWLFPADPRLAQVIHRVKWGSLLVIGAYGGLAVGHWVNGESRDPVVSLPARITSIRDVNLGAVAYRAMALESVEGRQAILGNASDQWDLYAGQDVRLTVRRGRLGLRRVLQVHGDMEKYYLRMLQVAPGARVALERLVGIYADRGDFARAMEWDDTLRTRYPDEYETTLHLGERLTDAKRFQDAIRVLRKAAAVSQEYDVLYALGYALAWGGSRDEAAQYLEKATEVDPTDWRAFYSLGYVYSGLGKYPEAKAAWGKVLQFLPHFPEVEQNLRALNARTP